MPWVPCLFSWLNAMGFLPFHFGLNAMGFLPFHFGLNAMGSLPFHVAK
jgi:hypothetical protein